MYNFFLFIFGCKYIIIYICTMKINKYMKINYWTLKDEAGEVIEEYVGISIRLAKKLLKEKGGIAYSCQYRGCDLVGTTDITLGNNSKARKSQDASRKDVGDRMILKESIEEDCFIDRAKRALRVLKNNIEKQQSQIDFYSDLMKKNKNNLNIYEASENNRSRCYDILNELMQIHNLLDPENPVGIKLN